VHFKQAAAPTLSKVSRSSFFCVGYVKALYSLICWMTLKPSGPRGHVWVQVCWCPDKSPYQVRLKTNDITD